MPERKLLAAPWTKIRIGAVCAALLILGAWLRPQTAAPLAPPEERPAPLLEQQVQQSGPAPFRGVEDAINRLPVRGLAVRTAVEPPVSSDFGRAVGPAPPVFAVTISESYVLTHAAALINGRTPIIESTDGKDLPSTVAAFDVATGMVLVSTPVPAGPVPVFAESPAQPGALVVGAARSSTVSVAVPLFITAVTAERYDLGATGTNPPPGLPVYALDGGLLAVSGGDGTAWRIRHVLDRLLSGAAAGSLPASIGITYQPIDGQLADAVGASGLAIVDVAAGGPAADAGLEIGDVIIGVGGVTGGGSELVAALTALRAEATTELSVRRGRKTMSVAVTPALAHDVITLPQTALPGVAAHELFEAETLAASGVTSDAVVLTIDGRRVAAGAAAARRAIPAKGPAVVLFDQRGRRFFATVDSVR